MSKPRARQNPHDADLIAAMMSSLLPVHAALTTEWLVDAASTASERVLGAPYAFVYFEDQDGQLSRKLPASDLRRRSEQRAIDAFGKDVLRAKLDPRESAAAAEALDDGAVVTVTPGELFGWRAEAESTDAAAKGLGIAVATIVPLETAGERVGALVLLLPEEADATHVRLLAEHIACAAVNLRQTQMAREQGVIDVIRSVFDARKLESELQREITRAQRYKRELSVVVIEATNLRLLREQFGDFLTHRLLQRLGEGLTQRARDSDIIGAYKESGYTMILTEAPPEGAAAAARRLLSIAARTRLEEHVPGLELHLVAGWATYPADGTATDSLFGVAERRMYSAAA